MVKNITYITIFLIVNSSMSQNNEIGVFLGGTNYIGEIGPTTYIDPFKYEGSRLDLLNNFGETNYSFGIIYRKSFDDRISARFQLNYAKIGSNDNWNGSEDYRKKRGKSCICNIAYWIRYI